MLPKRVVYFCTNPQSQRVNDRPSRHAPSAASRRLHACEDTTPTPSSRLHANILAVHLLGGRIRRQPAVIATYRDLARLEFFPFRCHKPGCGRWSHVLRRHAHRHFSGKPCAARSVRRSHVGGIGPHATSGLRRVRAGRRHRRPDIPGLARRASAALFIGQASAQGD